MLGQLSTRDVFYDTLGALTNQGLKVKLMNVARMLAVMCVLAITVGCSSDPDDKPVVVDVFHPERYGTFKYERAPDIDVIDSVDFGDLDAGESASIDIEIVNDGNEALKLASIATSPGFDVVLTEERLPEISPNTSYTVTVSFTAIDEQLRRGKLDIVSNDPDEPLVSVELIANHRVPCLKVDPNPLDFGVVDPDGLVVKEVEVSNCSTRSKTVFSMGQVITVTGPSAFNAFDRELYRDVELEVGEAVSIRFSFAPQGAGTYEAKAIFLSNDYAQSETELVLKGRGRDLFAPQAVIDAQNPDRGTVAVANPTGIYDGLPLDTVVLSAARSQDPEGHPLTFSWALVSRPMDSAAVMATNEGPDNDLWLDLAGTYVVELIATSDDGRVSEPATLTLYAIADQDVHIQLVWDNPNDPNQQDSWGSDVDIHLLHEGGVWNQKPWDCFWQNLEPDWGVEHGFNGMPVGYDDDPSLDIDDLDGWGPENINLDNPMAGKKYDVGVHYFEDHGYGAAFVTVRLYLGGVLVFEQRRQRMTDQEFWKVLQIDWPSRQVTPINIVSDSI